MMRVWRLSDVWRLSVAYIGPKFRTERPRKTKIGTEVAHVTRDSNTTFKVKRLNVNLQGAGILWRPPAQLVKGCGNFNWKLPKSIKTTEILPNTYRKLNYWKLTLSLSLTLTLILNP